jgi:outer membrane protein assembly factor BamB
MSGLVRRLPACLLALAVVTCAGAAAPAGAATAAASPAGPSWTVYHGNAAGTGVAAPVTAVSTGARKWTSPTLDGQLYGEPLVWGGRVYVATENDTVYALSAATGAVAWTAHVGTPVPASSLPCGDIAPSVGITGTPVIDPARDEIFALADELANGRPAHTLVGLNAATGQRELTQDVDPPGVDTAALLQRTGLNLTAGQVVLAMGGNFGDCAAYRGRVIAVPETGGKPRIFTVDAAAGQSQGAIWMGGAAPAVDSSGHVWVSVGNGSVHSSGEPYDFSDSLLELSPTMRLLQYFAPSSWASDNAQDLDMSTGPVLLPSGQVMLAGKSRIAYLVNGAHLGGIGGAQASLGSVCGSDIDGGSAVVGMTVYLPCLAGVVAVRAASSPPGLRLMWSSGTGGGPPIAAAGLIWTIGQNGMLYGLSPATGRVQQQAPIGSVANHFPTPAVAGGLLLAPAATDVVAFSTSGSRAVTPTPPPTAPTTGPTVPPAGLAKPPSSGGLPAGAIAGIVAGGLVLIGGGGWLLWRRRIRRHN